MNPPASYSTGLLRVALLLALYAILVLRWGYEFGRNDQMQTLAYASMLADPTLYPGDFYLRGIDERVPNERYVFSLLLSPFADHLALASLLGHILFSLLMLHFMDRIAGLFIRVEVLRWLCILVLFIPLYGVHLGGNELWYNSFFVSNVVKTLGMAGIWFMLSRRSLAMMLCFSAAAFLQPVIGLQLFGLSMAVLLSELITDEQKRRLRGEWLRWAGHAALWLCSAGLWIAMLKINFEQEAPPQPDHFFDILFIFRSPHHYWPPSWPLRDWLIIGALSAAALLYFRSRSGRLGWWVFWSIIACILFSLGTVLFRLTDVAALQGFKVSIWLEFFGLIALFAWAQDLFVHFRSRRMRQFSRAALLIGGMGAVALNLGYGSKLPMQVPRDYGAQYRNDPAVDISLKAKALSPPDALFIHPIGFTELKVYGQRSSFVDYKVLVHTRAAMHRWQERIRLIYGIAWDLPSPASFRYSIADEHYSTLSEEQFSVLRQAGVTHMIGLAGSEADLRELARNERYVLYDLRP